LGFQRAVFLAKKRDHIALLALTHPSTAARSICNGITESVYAKVSPDFSDTTRTNDRRCAQYANAANVRPIDAVLG